MKINGSLARKCLAELEESGQIKKVVSHSKMNIWSEYSFKPPLIAQPILTILSARAVTAE